MEQPPPLTQAGTKPSVKKLCQLFERLSGAAKSTSRGAVSQPADLPTPTDLKTTQAAQRILPQKAPAKAASLTPQERSRLVKAYQNTATHPSFKPSAIAQGFVAMYTDGKHSRSISVQGKNLLIPQQTFRDTGSLNLHFGDLQPPSTSVEQEKLTYLTDLFGALRQCPWYPTEKLADEACHKLLCFLFSQAAMAPTTLLLADEITNGIQERQEGPTTLTITQQSGGSVRCTFANEKDILKHKQKVATRTATWSYDMHTSPEKGWQLSIVPVQVALLPHIAHHRMAPPTDSMAPISPRMIPPLQCAQQIGALYQCPEGGAQAAALTLWLQYHELLQSDTPQQVEGFHLLQESCLRGAFPEGRKAHKIFKEMQQCLTLCKTTESVALPKLEDKLAQQAFLETLIFQVWDSGLDTLFSHIKNPEEKTLFAKAVLSVAKRKELSGVELFQKLIAGQSLSVEHARTSSLDELVCREFVAPLIDEKLIQPIVQSIKQHAKQPHVAGTLLVLIMSAIAQFKPPAELQALIQARCEAYSNAQVKEARGIMMNPLILRGLAVRATEALGNHHLSSEVTPYLALTSAAPAAHPGGKEMPLREQWIQRITRLEETLMSPLPAGQSSLRSPESTH